MPATSSTDSGARGRSARMLLSAVAMSRRESIRVPSRSKTMPSGGAAAPPPAGPAAAGSTGRAGGPGGSGGNELGLDPPRQQTRREAAVEQQLDGAAGRPAL